MPIIFKTLKAGTLLSGSSATVFSPASGESYIISNIRLYNNHTATVTVTAINVGNASAKPRINPGSITLSAGASSVFNTPEITLDGTNSIDIVASALPASGNGLNFALSGVQRV